MKLVARSNLAATVYERLGISTVATVEWTTDQALRRLMPDVTRAEYCAIACAETRRKPSFSGWSKMRGSWPGIRVPPRRMRRIFLYDSTAW